VVRGQDQRVVPRGQEREQLGLRAVRRGHDRLQQRVRPGQLEDPARGAPDRLHELVGPVVEGPVDDGEEFPSSASTISSASWGFEPTSL